MGTCKQNHNRNMQPVVGKDAQKATYGTIQGTLRRKKTKLTTVAKGEKVKGDFRIEKETNKYIQTDGKEYNMNRDKNSSKNGKDDNNRQ